MDNNELQAYNLQGISSVQDKWLVKPVTHDKCMTQNFLYFFTICQWSRHFNLHNFKYFLITYRFEKIYSRFDYALFSCKNY